ncbi:MAG: hypothetical protein JXR50_13395 [Prolixibacteraceae bacterium]|nr:hypothetical protein [Prolixibacteraceae bacterium]MBN2650731.1 hypothetical protein [Prolixibacteraceae bacterium]
MKVKLAYLATKVTVAVVLVALIAAKATAGESPNVKMLPHSTERAVVVINTDNINSEVSIEDLEGSVVYYEEGLINDKVYSKIFDFKNLEDGEYRLKVKNSFGENEVLFKVANNNIEVVKEAISTTPFFKVEDNMLKLSYLNHSLSNAYLTIFNEEGEIFKTELGKDFSINAGFDLKQLETGNYMASFGSNEKSYSYSFSK